MVTECDMYPDGSKRTQTGAIGCAANPPFLAAACVAVDWTHDAMDGRHQSDARPPLQLQLAKKGRNWAKSVAAVGQTGTAKRAPGDPDRLGLREGFWRRVRASRVALVSGRLLFFWRHMCGMRALEQCHSSSLCVVTNTQHRGPLFAFMLLSQHPLLFFSSSC